MSNNTELIAQLRWIGVGTLNFNDRCALMWEAAQALEQAGLEMGKRDHSSEQMKELTHSTATALAFAEQKIAEQAAIIEAAKADCVEAWSETRKFRDDWTAAMHKITEQAATLEAVRIARAKVWPGTALRGVLIAQYEEIDKILADTEGKL